jgi:hypothetical protein
VGSSTKSLGTRHLMVEQSSNPEDPTPATRPQPEERSPLTPEIMVPEWLSPWQPLEGEGKEAFQAYEIYRDMGTSRTLGKVSRLLHKTRQLMSKWADKWNWKARVEAVDRRHVALAQQHEVAETEEMRDRHLGIAMLLQRKCVERLALMDFRNVKLRDLIAATQMAILLERACLGMHTARTSLEEPIRVPESNMLTEIIDGGPSLEGINRELVRTIAVKMLQVKQLETELDMEKHQELGIEAIEVEPKQP